MESIDFPLAADLLPSNSIGRRIHRQRKSTNSLLSTHCNTLIPTTALHITFLLKTRVDLKLPCLCCQLPSRLESSLPIKTNFLVDFLVDFQISVQTLIQFRWSQLSSQLSIIQFHLDRPLDGRGGSKRGKSTYWHSHRLQLKVDFELFLINIDTLNKERQW